ncbi:MAG: hypothetical protein II135_04290, partial [Clostridia bacterium]|nr:hypothetical protein [Clostridia bacterium]
NLLGNIAGTVFLALFGAVYELFSHEVYSYFMIYAFAVPLTLGVLIYALLLILRKYPGRAALNLWNSGIAAISVGCVFRGVLEIYGTTNSLSVIYPVSGLLLLTAGLITWIVGLKRKQKNPDPSIEIQSSRVQ